MQLRHFNSDKARAACTDCGGDSERLRSSAGAAGERGDIGRIGMLEWNGRWHELMTGMWF
jgi:hypothetical protein